MRDAIGVHLPLLALEGRAGGAEIELLAHQLEISAFAIARSQNLNLLAAFHFVFLDLEKDAAEVLWRIEGQHQGLLPIFGHGPVARTWPALAVERIFDRMGRVFRRNDYRCSGGDVEFAGYSSRPSLFALLNLFSQHNFHGNKCMPWKSNYEKYGKYGVYRADMVVIGANIVTFLTLCADLALYYRFRNAEAGNAIVAAVNGAQQIGADVDTVLKESSHALVHGVAENKGSVRRAARGAVKEAIQASKSGRIQITPAEAASAAMEGATKAAAEIDERTTRRVQQAIADLMPLAA